MYSWLCKTFHRLPGRLWQQHDTHPRIWQKEVELQEETLSSLSFEDMEWTKYEKNPVIVPWKIQQSTPCNNNTSLEDPNAPTHSKENGQFSTSLFKTSKCLYWIEEIIQHRLHVCTENRGKCTSQHFRVHWKNCTTQCFKELQKEEQMFHRLTGRKEKTKVQISCHRQSTLK